MREDINVVEKANGLWALRRELSNDAYRRHSETDEGKKPQLDSLEPGGGVPGYVPSVPASHCLRAGFE